MDFIFSKLPTDIIKYILSNFDKHFIIRKGELISIIPKDDYRYNLLNYITITEDNDNSRIIIFGKYCRYSYNFQNLFNNSRKKYNIENDMISTDIYINKKTVKYEIFIGRIKKKNTFGNRGKKLMIL
jgi:hypothetical protein